MKVDLPEGVWFPIISILGLSLPPTNIVVEFYCHRWPETIIQRYEDFPELANMHGVYWRIMP